MQDRSGRVVVYTNGSCRTPGEPQAHAGVGVWFGAHHVLNMSGCVRGRQTCNSAQIQAVTNALWTAKRNGIRRINIYTNSELVINAANMYISIWLDNGWINKRGNRVQNYLDWHYLLKAKKGMEIKWTFVGNNRGNKGRDAAMGLAREYADRA